MEHVDETAERQTALQLVAPRQIRNVQDVGEHLLAAAPENKAGVRARHRNQAANRVRNRPVIASRMQFAQGVERFRHRQQSLC